MCVGVTLSHSYALLTPQTLDTPRQIRIELANSIVRQEEIGQATAWVRTDKLPGGWGDADTRGEKSLFKHLRSVGKQERSSVHYVGACTLTTLCKKVDRRTKCVERSRRYQTNGEGRQSRYGLLGWRRDKFRSQHFLMIPTSFMGISELSENTYVQSRSTTGDPQ